MRANEFLNEVEELNLVSKEPSQAQAITISIPASMFQQSQQAPAVEQVEQPQEDVEVSVNEPTEPEGDELADLVRLSGAGHTEPAQGANHTIAAPANDVVPENPVFISPLQQQLELQKQQGGKESHHINQIINQSTLGSTAGEQPEQSVYHDSPLEGSEYVGASTGAVDKLQNGTTTQGANKPWYKI
jgi:hypothetical protein